MANSQSYNCPMCGQVDRVEKVSALVGAGTSAGFYTGPTSGTGLMAGVSQTALSQKLAPPSKPYYDSPYGSGTKFSIGLFGLFTFAGLIGLITQDIPSLWLTEIIIWGTILALILVYKQRKANERHRRVDAAMPLYTATYKKWNELYYCARNDVVFMPGEPGTCVPASEMERLL